MWRQKHLLELFQKNLTDLPTTYTTHTLNKTKIRSYTSEKIIFPAAYAYSNTTKNAQYYSFDRVVMIIIQKKKMKKLTSRESVCSPTSTVFPRIVISITIRNTPLSISCPHKTFFFVFFILLKFHVFQSVSNNKNFFPYYFFRVIGLKKTIFFRENGHSFFCFLFFFSEKPQRYNLCPNRLLHHQNELTFLRADLPYFIFKK